jgi:acetolactate synthase-1/2/3 large subunit
VLTAPTDAEPGRAVRVPQAGARPADLEEIRDRLEAANRPLVIAGGGGWSDAGRTALRGFVEANGLPVLVGFRNQDLLDNDSPSYAGDAGLGKTLAVRKLIADADLILAVGVRFGEILTDGFTLLRVPHPEQGLIHAHASAGELNKIHTADLPIHAHPDALMTALATLRLPSSSRWEARTAEARAAWLASLATPPQPGALEMGEVMRCLQADLPRDAILTNGAGNFSIWLNKHFRFTGGQRLLGPQSGAMGYGLPAAIAAKVARPDACVVAFTGDGDFQMTMAELGCAMQARARPIVLVVNNGSYGTIRMHQERTYPGRVSFTDIENPDFVAIAAAYGFHAERVTRTADFAAAFGRARGSATGALLELVVDIESLTPRQTLAAARASAGG